MSAVRPKAVVGFVILSVADSSAHAPSQMHMVLDHEGIGNGCLAFLDGQDENGRWFGGNSNRVTAIK